MTTNTITNDAARDAGQKIQTPWGVSHYVKQIAPGILKVSTGGHGGFMLDEDAWQLVDFFFPDFKPWAGKGWLEEDCDANVAVLCYPSLFPVAHVFYAVRCARSGNPYFNFIGKFWETEKGKDCIRIHDAFAAEIANKWERGSMSTQGKGWSVSFSRQSDGAEKRVQMPEYPEQQFYTDVELAEVGTEIL